MSLKKVWLLQTVAGLNIVSEISTDKSTDTEWALVNPLIHNLMPHPSQQGAMRESFGELAQFAKSTEAILLQKIHVFVSYEPEDRLVNNYKKAIEDMKIKKSGIIMPNQKPLSLSL